MQTNRSGYVVLVAVFGFVALASSVLAQETTRVSVDSSNAEGNGRSHDSAISPDGRFVAFASDATDLVANDTNGFGDVFVRELATGITTRVSLNSGGSQCAGSSYTPALSSDGQFVAFVSRASNLVAFDRNKFADVFVHDCATGKTERVSVDSSGAEANFISGDTPPAISADGRYVVFDSGSNNLVAGDHNNADDIFVHDRTTGITERVSVDSHGTEGNADSESPSISADGRFVTFASFAWNLVPGDTNWQTDIFVHDRSTHVTERVSVSSAGVQGDRTSNFPSISADGAIVAFLSGATNLVRGDTRDWCDVFVHDRTTGITERVSVDSFGRQGNGNSGGIKSAISSDGRFVAFESRATNLVAGDTNGNVDVFVHDRSTGSTRRASIDSAGAQGSRDSDSPSLSADGRFVAFSSLAPKLVAGDTNGCEDVFVHERCQTVASWTNYGAGLAGTNGVPAFTARSNPALGASVTLDLGNSSGGFTVGVLFLGHQRTTLPTSWGGDLLVAPTLTQIIGLAPAGISFAGAIPDDERFCGITVDLEAIEADAGAAKGVSFTAGLELVLGD